MMQTPEHEEEAEVTRVVKEYVTQLTGKQTIYLMMQLAEEINKRGGTTEFPMFIRIFIKPNYWNGFSIAVKGCGTAYPARGIFDPRIRRNSSSP